MRSPPNSPGCGVIFAREPTPGRVKKRLAAGIGGVAAARVYELILQHTLGVAVASGSGRAALASSKNMPFQAVAVV